MAVLLALSYRSSAHFDTAPDRSGAARSKFQTQQCTGDETFWVTLTLFGHSENMLGKHGPGPIGAAIRMIGLSPESKLHPARCQECLVSLGQIPQSL